MAADMTALLHAPGFPRFAIAAQDRGARLAHRLALDAPEAVQRLAVMDIVPTRHHVASADSRFALGCWHSVFPAQPHAGPERRIRADIGHWFRFQTSREPKDESFLHPAARADHLDALHAPGTIAAICEDTRAAAGADPDHDRASRAEGRRLRCPLLVLRGAKGKIGQWHGPSGAATPAARSPPAMTCPRRCRRRCWQPSCPSATRPAAEAGGAPRRRALPAQGAPFPLTAEPFSRIMLDYVGSTRSRRNRHVA
jgi:pimeloyl-ACP methyl ester carboxylesterase